MRVIYYNEKGGPGKTTLATQTAMYFDATIIEMDPYGVLTQTLDEDRVFKLELSDQVPNITEGDVIFDFGGFADVRLNQAATNADLVIIPFNPTINALGTTIKSYEKVKELDLPVLFVANSVIKEQDAIDAIDFIKELTGDDIDYYIIPHTRAIQTAENEGIGVIDLANGSGLKKHTYRKIGNTMQNYMNKIKEYLK